MSISLDRLMIEKAGPEQIGYLTILKEKVMRTRYRPVKSEQDFETWRRHYCTDTYFENLMARDDVRIMSIGSLRDPSCMVIMIRHKEYMEIDDLLCREPGRGDGKRLIKSCLTYAQLWKYNRVIMDVYPGYPKIQTFLEDHGFRFIGPAQNDLGMPMQRYEYLKA